MLIDIRWLPLLFTNLILVLAIQYLNGILSPYLLHVYINAALIIAPALLLRLRGGLTVVIITSLFYDAGSTGSFGLATPLMLMAYTTIYITRSSLKQPGPIQCFITAVIANSGLFAIHSFTLYNGYADPGQYFANQLISFILSTILISFTAVYMMLVNQSILSSLNLNPPSADYVS